MGSGNTCVKVANMKQHNYIIMMVTEVVTCVSLLSYFQLKVTNQQHNLDCTLTTTIWNQHSKRQTSGKISKRVAAPRDSKVLPRWRFLTPLDGNEYYYQVLLLNVPFRSEGELISDPNASGTFKEECFLRNLVRQFADQRNR